MQDLGHVQLGEEGRPLVSLQATDLHHFPATATTFDVTAAKARVVQLADGVLARDVDLLRACIARAKPDAVVLTGDIHSSWVMDLTPDPENLMAYNPLTGAGSLAVESVGTSVTSTGLDQLAAVPDLASALRLRNPHMQYIEVTRRGYLLMDITPGETVGEYWYVPTVAAPDAGETFAIGYATAAGSNFIARQPRRAPVAPLENPPVLAP